MWEIDITHDQTEVDIEDIHVIVRRNRYTPTYLLEAIVGDRKFMGVRRIKTEHWSVVQEGDKVVCYRLN